LVAAALGYAYGLAGRVAEATPLLERSRARAADLKLRANEPLRTTWLGEVYLLARNAERAASLAAGAVSLAVAQKERAHQAYALRLAGDLARRRDPPDPGEADSSLREALAVAQELGMRPLIGRCYLALGELHAHRGTRDDADRDLRSAITLFAAMGMTRLQEHADAAVTALR